MPDCDVGGLSAEIESHRAQLRVYRAIYSLGHWLLTLTAVPRRTQPSTLRGTVNRI